MVADPSEAVVTVMNRMRDEIRQKLSNQQNQWQTEQVAQLANIREAAAAALAQANATAASLAMVDGEGNLTRLQGNMEGLTKQLKTFDDEIKLLKENVSKNNDGEKRQGKKASESNAVSCLKILKDKKDFKQWHDKLTNGISQLYPKARDLMQRMRRK